VLASLDTNGSRRLRSANDREGTPMFRTAELGQKISKAEYRQKVPALRERLLEAQGRLREAEFPVIVLFAGVDGAGKGEMANLLSEWMDPRHIVTRAFAAPSEEERERPEYWRFWRDLPPQGKIGVFLSAWYSKPLLDHVYDNIGGRRFDDELDRILWFERTLTNDGAVIVKFWMHLGRQAQKRRLKNLEKDPLTRWRVTDLDWKHYDMYGRFVASAEHAIMRTSTGRAPWHIVEGVDHPYRSLRVGTLLAETIERALERGGVKEGADNGGAEAERDVKPEAEDRALTVLDSLDMGRSLGKRDYRKRLGAGQARLNLLHRRAREHGVSTILVFEGWDAAGKGGAIRRITTALDARDFQVISIAAPTDEERAHHYLWRFWRHLSRAGRFTIFDRSWYGRVLVERIEGFATEDEWRRAYAEINEFERQLVDFGIVLVKLWLHITQEEQEARFKERAETPHKSWKLTDEDWRNREQWELYEAAVHDMVERSSTQLAPWHLIEANDKRYARVKVLDTVCERLEAALKEEG
jgi:polyphosphate:AMP phosphotransferase